MRTGASRLPFVASLLVGLACADRSSEPIEPAVVAEMDQGSRFKIISVDTLRTVPGGDPVRLVVAADGSLAVVVNGSPRIAVLSPMLTLEQMIGRTGEGPGELGSAIGHMAFSGNTLFVGNGPRVARFVRGEGWKAEHWGVLAGHNLVSVAGSALYFWRPNPAAGFPIVRTEGQSRRTHELTSTTDSFFRAVIEPERRPEGPRQPVVATSSDWFVVGSGYRYRLQATNLVDGRQYPFGREIPPRHRTARELAEDRERYAAMARNMRGPDGRLLGIGASEARLKKLATDTIPHFFPGGFAISGETVFVIGHANDSTFVDLFRAGDFLGRAMIDCRQPGSVSLSWPWLALLCLVPEETSESGEEIRRYRLAWENDDGI